MLLPLGPLCSGSTTASPGHPGGAGAGLIAHQGPVPNGGGLGCTELPSCTMRGLEVCGVTRPLSVGTRCEGNARRRSRTPGTICIKQPVRERLLSKFNRHTTLHGSIKPLILEFLIICPQIRWDTFLPPWLLIKQRGTSGGCVQHGRGKRSSRLAAHTIPSRFSAMGGCFENLIKFYSFNFVTDSPLAFFNRLTANEPRWV